MYAAVAQLAVVQVGFLGSFACQFGHACHGFALFFALLYLLHHHLCHVGVFMQKVIHLTFDEVAHILVDAHTSVGFHGQRAQFYLGLTFKHRLLHVECDGGHQSVADVGIFKILLEKLLDGFGDMLLEGALVGTSLCGMLSVDKGVILLAVLVGMGKGYLNIFPFEVDDGIDAIVGHVIVEQVFETVAAHDAPFVIHDGKPRVEIGVVAEHGGNDVVVEGVVDKQAVVWFKEDVGACFLFCVFSGIALQLSLFKHSAAHLALSVGAYLEMAAQCVDGLDAHTIQSHTLLESLGIVFSASVEHAHRFYQFALRDAATIVAHGDAQLFIHIHLYPVACLHLELVYRVVYHLFEQHIDAIFGQRTVAQSSDIHTRACAHMLHVREVSDVFVSVVYDRL